jgi:transcriptional regulator of heat shock response
MADLESMGYLYSPHTSAGRVPTEKGYKFYVNFLVEFERISQLEEALIGKIAEISHETHNRQQDILKSAIRYACQKTNLAGVLLAPQHGKNPLRSIKLFRVLENKAMLVTVDDFGNINDQIVNIPAKPATMFSKSSRFCSMPSSASSSSISMSRITSKKPATSSHATTICCHNWSKRFRIQPQTPIQTHCFSTVSSTF